MINLGICFGLKLFASSIAGLVTASLLLQLLAGLPGVIPAFFLMLLWLACSGASYCIGGTCLRFLSLLRRR